MEALDRVLRELGTEHNRRSFFGSFRVYAIAFDLDTDSLKREYHNESYGNAYGDIQRRLEAEGFTWMQGSLYYGNKGTDPVKCVLVIQRLANELPWFGKCIRHSDAANRGEQRPKACDSAADASSRLSRSFAAHHIRQVREIV